MKQLLKVNGLGSVVVGYGEVSSLEFSFEVVVGECKETNKRYHIGYVIDCKFNYEGWGYVGLEAELGGLVGDGDGYGCHETCYAGEDGEVEEGEEAEGVEGEVEEVAPACEVEDYGVEEE